MKKIFYEHRKAKYFIAVVSVILILWTIAIQLTLASHFDGEVQNVYYNVKHVATVTINGEDYTLNSTSWDHSIIISKRDKLIKKKGDMHLLLIKYKTKDTVDLLMK